jgi:hypothetical protein
MMTFLTVAASLVVGFALGWLTCSWLSIAGDDDAPDLAQEDGPTP